MAHVHIGVRNFQQGAHNLGEFCLRAGVELRQCQWLQQQHSFNFNITRITKSFFGDGRSNGDFCGRSGLFTLAGARVTSAFGHGRSGLLWFAGARVTSAFGHGRLGRRRRCGNLDRRRRRCARAFFAFTRLWCHNDWLCRTWTLGAFARLWRRPCVAKVYAEQRFAILQSRCERNINAAGRNGAFERRAILHVSLRLGFNIVDILRTIVFRDVSRQLCALKVRQLLREPVF